MINEKTIYLGTIVKTHGVKGEVILNSELNLPNYFEDTELIFAEINGGLVPFFIENDGVRVRSSRSAILRICDIDSEMKAKLLISKNIFIQENSTQIPIKLPVNELIGYKVIDKIKGYIGLLADLNTSRLNPLLIVENGNTEIYIPLQNEFIDGINDKEKTILINTPEGLIDLNS